MTEVTNLPVRHKRQIAAIKFLENLLRMMRSSTGPNFAQGVVILMPDPHIKGKVRVVAPKGMDVLATLKAALKVSLRKRPPKDLSNKTLIAIEQIVTLNEDTMTLLKSRGVNHEHIQEVFRLARLGLKVQNAW